jgi:hypothetical protein
MFSEQFADLFLIEGDKAPEHNAHHQKNFQSLRKTLGERSQNSQPTMKEMRNAKTNWITKYGIACTFITGAPVTPRRFSQGFGIA